MGNVVLRFKVKHVFVLFLVLAAASLGFAHASQSVLFTRAEAAREAGQRELALALYDRFLDRCGKCPQGAEALFWTAIGLAPGDDNKIVISSGGATGWVSRNEILKDLARVEERYRRLIDEYPDSDLAGYAVRNLVDQLMHERRWDEAEHYIAWGLEQSYADSVQADLMRKHIDVAYRTRDFERTIALGTAYMATWPGFNVFDVYLTIGDRTSAG